MHSPALSCLCNHIQGNTLVAMHVGCMQAMQLEQELELGPNGMHIIRELVNSTFTVGAMHADSCLMLSLHAGGCMGMHGLIARCHACRQLFDAQPGDACCS